MSSKKRILSGMRPTGPLHLGNLHGALLNRGVSLAPSAYEVMFVSLAHTDDVIDQTVAAFEDAVTEIS